MFSLRDGQSCLSRDGQYTRIGLSHITIGSYREACLSIYTCCLILPGRDGGTKGFDFVSGIARSNAPYCFLSFPLVSKAMW